jgi:hypothetical protein
MKMKTKHTQGPWRAEKWDYSQCPNKLMVQTDKDAVCEILDLWCMNERTEERDANARLIAAAPEMLEALKELATAAEHRDNTMGDPYRLIECKANLESAARNARAAIAKAEVD